MINKNELQARMDRIAQSDWFKKVYHNGDCGVVNYERDQEADAAIEDLENLHASAAKVREWLEKELALLESPAGADWPQYTAATLRACIAALDPENNPKLRRTTCDT